MRGHIVKRGKNSYSLKVSLGKDAASGKYKYQWTTVKGTKKEAEKRLGEILHQLDTGTFTKPGKMTVGEYLDQWLKDYRPSIGPHSAQTYEFFIERHIKPAIGQIPLTSLKPEHLQRLYSDKLSTGRCDGSGGLSGRSVRYIHVTIHRALKSAARLGIISRNVADSVDVPGVEHHEMKTMTEDDIHAFLEAARSTPYHTLFYLALFTGMRRSELLALRWSDMDLLMCQASVNRTLHRLNNGEIIFRETKTAKSRRMVALSPRTCLVLQEYRQKQEQDRLLAGNPLQESDLVFSQLDGKPLLPDSVTHAFMVLARRTGLKGIHLHSARHTHATLMLKQGIHPRVVQERLGHASIAITLDVYSHVTPGLQEAAARRFDDLALLPEPEKEAAAKN